MKSFNKYIRIAIIVAIVFQSNNLFAQITPGGNTLPITIDLPIMPAAFRSDATINYVRTWQPVMPISNAALVPQQSVANVKQTTAYVDGLARVMQTVSKQSSPDHVDQVSYKLFDDYGRETIQYLPFNSTGADGNFKTNAVNGQKQFFDFLSNNGNQYYGEQVFFGKTILEDNPFQRPYKVMAAGNSWTGRENGITYYYGFNSADEEVHIWQIADDPGSIPENKGIYNDGELIKTRTSDEHKRETIEYKNKEGNIILKKLQLSNSPSTAYEGWLCTYYVYDDYGMLRCVIPPKVVELISASDWKPDIYMDELCFRYEYDNRDRMIIKKIPGAKELWMVYDNRDRLVMSQDANMRDLGKWLYTKYDNTNRPIETGLLESTDDRVTHQDNAGQSGNYPDLTSFTHQYLTLNFYDYSIHHLIPDDLNKLTANNNPWPEVVTAATESKLIYGKQTGTTASILANPAFIDGSVVFTYPIYDDRGRTIQTQYQWGEQRHKVVSTSMYDFSGKVLSSYERHNDWESGADIVTTVLNKLSYDEGGRVISTKKQMNDDGVDHTITQHEYNSTGQLKIKELGTNPDPSGTTRGVEDLNYQYNIRGWLSSINKGFVENTGNTANWFGQTLSYDHGFTQSQLNGNISGIQWRSRGDMKERAYGFKYDNANRLLKADFRQLYNGTWNTDEKIDYSVMLGDGDDPTKAYDGNGNILSMLQTGFKVAYSDKIDVLKYTYYENSNKLKNVIDFNNDPTTHLGDFRTSDNSPNVSAKASYIAGGNIDLNTIYDYAYDGNGNMREDMNKDIGNNVDPIKYSYLNLPQTITIPQNGAPAFHNTINYVYDATGNKLQKIVNEPKAGIVTITTYFGGIVYERKNFTNQTAGVDKIQFLSHEDGRIRYAQNYTPNGPGDYAWQFDYFVKDHLGNVRSILTEQQDIHKYMATFETANTATETALFSNITETAQAISVVQGYPSDPTTNPNAYTSKLNGSAKRIGASITLKVMAGDKVDLATKCWYKDNGATSNPNQTPEDIVNNLLISLINGVPGLSGGKVSGTDINNNSLFTGGINSFLDSHPENTTTPTNPKAYLNWILFDEQFKYVPDGSGFIKVPGYSNDIQTLAQTGIPISKSGYLFVYLSNETQHRDVFFDNLVVQHYTGPLLEETHYYPFGLTMAGISSKAAGGIENKKKWNVGSELNTDFDINLYETFYRSLDPQLGRFWQVDPKPTENESPYVSMGNNPISNVDPRGDYFFGLFGSTSEQRKAARALAAETGGEIHNITKKSISVSYVVTDATTGAAVVGKTGFYEHGFPTILGKQAYNKFLNERAARLYGTPASGRVEMADDPITMLGPSLVRGLLTKILSATILKSTSLEVVEDLAGAESKWVFGAFKSEAKWASQLAKRGWTPEQITEAITNGEKVAAQNLVNPANGATRYINPTTGQSVVVDNVTKEVLHVGGPGFKY